MQPGTYQVSCVGAAVGRGRIVINYRVIDGPHTGTALRQWIGLILSGARTKALLDDLVDFNRTRLGLGINIASTIVDLETLFADERIS
jgi:hypothetical protein